MDKAMRPNLFPRVEGERLFPPPRESFGDINAAKRPSPPEPSVDGQRSITLWFRLVIQRFSQMVRAGELCRSGATRSRGCKRDA
jgi:hypothetical protein